MRKILYFLMLMTALSWQLFSQGVPEISSRDAFSMLQNPSTYLIDVRSVAEYVFIGHPDMAYNIPLMFWSEKEQQMIPNENFLNDLRGRFKAEDILVFICRSGGRSLKAAQMAKQAGFSKVYSISEGFEGEKDEKGCRILSGWKNSGLPYSYEIKKELIYSPQNLETKE